MRPPYGPTRIDRPQFLKAYPEWIDGAPLPGGYKTPFITFSGEDKQSPTLYMGSILLDSYAKLAKLLAKII